MTEDKGNFEESQNNDADCPVSPTRAGDSIAQRQQRGGIIAIAANLVDSIWFATGRCYFRDKHGKVTFTSPIREVHFDDKIYSITLITSGKDLAYWIPHQSWEVYTKAHLSADKENLFNRRLLDG